MKKHSVEERIAASLNSQMPTEDVLVEAKDYMKNETYEKDHYESNNPILKLIAFGMIFVVIVLAVLPVFLIYNDKKIFTKTISAEEIYEKVPIYSSGDKGDRGGASGEGSAQNVSYASSSLKPDPRWLYYFEAAEEGIKRYFLKGSDELLYLSCVYFVPEFLADKFQADRIEEIVVMKGHTDALIEPLEEYQQLNNTFVKNGAKCRYKVLDSKRFCFSFSVNDYDYYFIIYGADKESIEKLIGTITRLIM